MTPKEKAKELLDAYPFILIQSETEAQMTPQEKAKELYCKYTDALNIRDLQTTANPFAKQCALLAVDEILNSNPRYPNNVHWDDAGFSLAYYYEAQFQESEKYWQQVKQEIVKI
jgi:hypothetical protein